MTMAIITTSLSVLIIDLVPATTRQDPQKEDMGTVEEGSLCGSCACKYLTFNYGH